MPRLTALLDGYRRFRETGWARERERWSELAEGQSPEVLVIACSDSRVDPATIFDAKPEEILVMGHGFCGGCAASLTGQFDNAREGEGQFIAHWIDLLDEARDKVRAEHHELDRAAFHAMEREGVR